MTQTKSRQPIELTMIVFDKDDKQIREHKIDLRERNVKQWVFNALWWAAKNGYSVEFNKP